jgi:hypothetical protein
MKHVIHKGGDACCFCCCRVKFWTSQCVVVRTHPSPVIQSDPPLRDCSLCTFRTISLDKADLCATCRKLDPWGTLLLPFSCSHGGRAQILKSYRLGQLLGTKCIVLEGSGKLRSERKSFLGTDSYQSARSSGLTCSDACAFVHSFLSPPQQLQQSTGVSR